MHTDEEMILVLNEENDDVLIQSVLLGRHGVGGVGEHAGLEDGCEILGRHPIQVRLGGKHGEQIKDVQQQLAVQGREFRDELLISRYGRTFVKGLGRLRRLGVAGSLGSGPFQRFSELLIEIQRNHRFGEVIEVATEDVGGIMNCVTVPNEAFSVPIRGVKQGLQLLDSLFGPVKAEDALNLGRFETVSSGPRVERYRMDACGGAICTYPSL